MTEHHVEERASITPEAALAASYTAQLQRDPELAASTHEALVAAHHANNLLIDGRLLCNVLRPRFISIADYSALLRDSEIMAGIMERAGSLLLDSDRLLDLIWADDAEREIWSIDPGYPGFTVTSRLDSFMTNSTPHYVEYNAESPASIGFCDVLSEIFLGLPVTERWAIQPMLERLFARDALTETLLWAYWAWGGDGTPSMAIVDWETVLTRRDFELCAEFFRARDIPTIITDPRRLEYRGGKLWYGETQIDLIYRRVLLHELLEKAAEARPLLQAYREGAVCMVNSPRSKLLHKKAVMALLSERTIPLELSDEEQAVIDRTIPWTRRLRTGQSTYRGGLIDLPAFVLVERERLVLKPNDDYGGRGVVLGWEVTPGQWERAVEEAMEEPFVVQERVPIPREEFPVWREDRVEAVELLVDTDPLLFRGKVRGILTRVSGSALLNVTAGTGSTTPTFVVSDEE